MIITKLQLKSIIKNTLSEATPKPGELGTIPSRAQWKKQQSDQRITGMMNTSNDHLGYSGILEKNLKVSNADAKFIKSKIDNLLPQIYQKWVKYINSESYFKQFEYSKTDEEGYLKNIPISPKDFRSLIVDKSKNLNMGKGLSSNSIVLLGRSNYGGIIESKYVLKDEPPFTAALSATTEGKPLSASELEAVAPVEMKRDHTKLDKHGHQSIKHFPVKIKRKKVIFIRTYADLYLYVALEQIIERYIYYGGKSKETKEQSELDLSNFNDNLFTQQVTNIITHELQHIENGFVIDASYHSFKSGPYEEYLETILDVRLANNYMKKPSELRVRLNKFVMYAKSPPSKFFKYIKEVWDIQKKREGSLDKNEYDEEWTWLDDELDVEEEEGIKITGIEKKPEKKKKPKKSVEGMSKKDQKILPIGHKGKLNSSDTSSVETRIERMLELGYIYWSMQKEKVDTLVVDEFYTKLRKLFNNDTNIMNVLAMIHYAWIGNDFKEIGEKLPLISKIDSNDIDDIKT